MKTIWVDGGMRRGSGYTVWSDGTRFVKKHLGKVRGSPECEWYALITALEENNGDLKVVMDARYVIEQVVAGRGKKFSKPLCARVLELVESREVQWEWIPRDQMEAYVGC